MTLRNSEVTLTSLSTTFGSSYTVATQNVAVFAPSSVSLTNFGTILSADCQAVLFGAGGAVINSGLIDSTSWGIEQGILFNGNAIVVNSGLIEGNTGVQVNGNGALSLTNSDTIIGESGSAIWVNGTLAGDIVNSGLLLEKNGGNFAGGGAIDLNAAGIVTNTGSIISQHDGGFGEALGVELAGGTLINAGLIEGAGYHGATFAVDFTAATGGDSLILDPGQTLDGIALAHGAGNFITLGGTSPGTLANPANYIGFTLVSVAAGADWKIGNAAGAESFSGIPAIDIGFGAELSLAGSLDSGAAPTTINMQGNGEHSTLDLTGTEITAGGAIPNPIVNFGTTDTIIVGTSNFFEIPGDTYTFSYANGVLTIDDLSWHSTVHASIAPPSGVLTTGNFSVSLTPQGAVITDNPCFAAGTRILTPYGEVAVEHLKPGDEVLTARNGAEGAAKIIWVGQRSIDLARHAMSEKVRPIRILAGAFGFGLPERDLRLSPDHALYIDGHLIEAKTLVNGVTVIAERYTRHVTYHHIELARHDIVLAEGLPAETYLESGNRAMFDDSAKPLVLHPDFVNACRQASCAPLLTDGAALRAVRQRLLDRAIALGFAATGDVDLVVEANAQRIPPVADPDGELLFVLPAGAKNIALLSGAGVPAELSADPSDRRVLGVDVAALTLVAGGNRLPIALDDAAHTGFHDMEGGHRWTNGAARIALPPHSGRAVLEVAINGQAPRWRRPSVDAAMHGPT